MNLTETYNQKKTGDRNRELEESRKKISELEERISELSSENSDLRKCVREKSAHIVKLQESDKELRKAERLKQEAENIRNTAEKDSAIARKKMDSASKIKRLADDQKFRMQMKQMELDREQASIPYKIEAGIEEKAAAVYRRTAGKLFPPFLLSAYSVLVTILLLVLKADRFEEAGVFAGNAWKTICWTWETGFPFVFESLRETGSNELTAWMLAVLAAFVAAGIVAAAIIILARLIRKAKKDYKEKDETARGIEMTIACILLAVLVSITVTEKADFGMTWLSLALILAAAGNLLCHGIYCHRRTK